MVIFYKKWKKYYETKLTKNKIYLNIRKITNHPPFPVNILKQKKKFNEIQLTENKMDLTIEK